MNHHLINNKTILDLFLENIKNNKTLELLINNNAPYSQRHFFTLMNENETINNVPLGTGLNISTFSPVEKYTFCDLQNIFKYFEKGVYLRQVFLPKNNPKLYVKHCGDKDCYKSNMIILGKKYDLRKPETYIELIKIGLDIYDVNVVYWVSKNGYTDVIKSLVLSGANKKTAIYAASKHNQLDVVKMILDNNDDENIIITTIKCCIMDKHNDFIKYLFSKYPHLINSEILQLLDNNKPKSVVKIIPSKPVNIITRSKSVNIITPSKPINIITPSKPINIITPSKPINIITPKFNTLTSNLEDLLYDACIKNNKQIVDELINLGANYRLVHARLIKNKDLIQCDDVIKYLARLIMN
ncbi:ankyrin repeat protein [Moumouvirus australiensis]|uniref:Ankyrin repeat protein n=1 Tax=Moumouvirus australiensis TaxID=2109587 RepID=A0A2P1EKU3_9VIRU|nr:ankyrin repeat protein [Moumouvirus australiensis]AVL94506.1 ankyrin repeat protein [Moumouvirus australiensis]